MDRLIPHSFDPPTSLRHARFRLEPLGPEHNGSDYQAWTSSLEHIRSTPGFVGGEWPHEMTLEENRADLVEHADHFRDRVGFTYTVLAPDRDEVIGCVYVYGDRESDADVHVRSWVRADMADLDPVLDEVVYAWLTSEAWPFASVRRHPR